MSVDMSVNLDNSIADVTQKSFLSNTNNKDSFIGLLAHALSCNDHNVVRCEGDGDTSIVSNIVDFACSGMDVSLIAADIYLLMMLHYMWNDMTSHIF